MAEFPKDRLLVVYCWGPGCNGATKAAVKLSALGFSVKEMIGGITYWKEEGYPIISGGLGPCLSLCEQVIKDGRRSYGAFFRDEIAHQ